MFRSDPDTMQEVRDRAKRNGHSVAEELRLLVDWGLMSADEHEKLNGK